MVEGTYENSYNNDDALLLNDIKKSSLIIYIESGSKEIDKINKIFNGDLRDIKIGKTEFDDYYYMTLVYQNLRERILIGTLHDLHDQGCMCPLFQLNNDYKKLINYLIIKSNLKSIKNFTCYTLFDELFLKIYLITFVSFKLRILKDILFE